MMASGILGIYRETFDIVIRKPIGDPPTEEMQRKIDRKIRNTRPFIRKVMIENLKEKKEKGLGER